MRLLPLIRLIREVSGSSFGPERGYSDQSSSRLPFVPPDTGIRRNRILNLDNTASLHILPN